MSLKDRLIHSWNAFREYDNNSYRIPEGPTTTYRPDRLPLLTYNSQTILASIITRISIDVASLSFYHARVNENGFFEEEIDSNLNRCLRREANLDQSNWDFWLDVCVSLLDEGYVAVVPVETGDKPIDGGAIDIRELRVGRILEWKPDNVRVHLYDARDMLFKDIWVPKKMTAIIQNPFYSVMNAQNSTLQRLTKKLALLDYVDTQSGSGKLDLIIQLPYTLKGETRVNQAEERKKKIETQLAGSKYGIAYIDATERITQLNRPVDNNLLASVESLTKTLYNQLGMSESVFDGTANEQVMLNYYAQTIDPIAMAISTEFARKFLTKTARTQRQNIVFMRDPFRLVPVSQLAEIADKMGRNEIMVPNEMRGVLGLRPSDDPEADVLRNRNLNQSNQVNTVPGAIDNG